MGFSDSQFCIAVAGFKAAGAQAEKIYGESYTTPTLHVFGNSDVVVGREMNNTLLNISATKRVEVHTGGKSRSPLHIRTNMQRFPVGHTIPLSSSWYKFWEQYLVDPTGDIPSPDPEESPVSAYDGSGTDIEGMILALRARARA